MRLEKNKLGILGILITFLSCATIFYFGTQNSPIRHPENFTTPLNTEDVRYLCRVFFVPSGDKRCQEGNDVYAANFMDEFDAMLSQEGLDFTQWQATFGRYESYCQLNKIEIYQCDYDFHRDRMFVIYVYFDEHNDDKVKDWGVLHDED